MRRGTNAKRAKARSGRELLRAGRWESSRRGGGEEVVPGRRCHDCGRPTPDYRCPACWAAFRRRHGVTWDDAELGAELGEEILYV